MRNSLRNIETRRNEILAYINQHDLVDVEALTSRFDVSHVTIRKDLDQLAKNGLITRTYGGASKIQAPALMAIPSSSPEMTSLELIERSIAKAAADMIDENDIVLINSSLTASYVIEYLGSKRVTIVTNNLSILTRKRHPNTTLILTGGQVTEGRMSLTGMYTNNTMTDIIGTKCIIGVRGISSASGITSQVPDEAAINQLLIQHTSNQVIVVADSRKIGVRDSFSSSDIRSIHYLITNADANPTELAKIEKAGVKIKVIPTAK